MPCWQEWVNLFVPEGSKVAKRKEKPESIHDRDRIIVRLPDGMRDKITNMAQANGRSMTAEVIAALEQHLQGADRISKMWDFFELHRENIESIPIATAAVENLENYTSRVEGEFRPILFRYRQAKEREARKAALPPITSEQADEIRRLVKETGASEAPFLKLLRVASFEEIKDFKEAVNLLEARRRERSRPK
jgi:predicted DNA-binding protein